MQDAKTFWDKAAEKYALSPIRDMAAYEYTLGRTRSYLKPDDRVLEVGCGTGSTALLLSQDVSHVTASDISDNMIAIARRKAADQNIENVSFVASDMFNETDVQGSYDAVLAFNLIHLVKDTEGAFRRVRDLLKPGGVFVSKTVCKPGKDAPFAYRLMLPLIPIMQWFGKAPFVQFHSVQRLEDLMIEAGFKIIETGNHPSPSRFIVAQKM